MKIEEQADILLNRCNDANGATYVFNVEDVSAVAEAALSKPAATQVGNAMTRRDWFAAHAMQALVDYGWGSGDAASRLLLTAQAYAIADEMQKARV